MKRRSFIKTAASGCFLGVVAPSFARSPKKILRLNDLHYVAPRLREKYDQQYADRPTFVHTSQLTGKNILFITSDQHHYMCMGYNDPRIKTPNLDRLARRGIIFDRAYCPNPTSTPSRASMITGKYASQHGAWSLGTKLSEKELTVGDCFREAGYHTTLIGKAHFQPLEGSKEYPSCEAYPILQDLDFWRTFNGPYYGFEHVEICRNHTDEAHVGQHYALWMEENGAQNWRDWFRKPTGNSKPQRYVWNIPEKYHYDNWIAERTNYWLEQYKQKNERFFLWASFFDPHPSYLVPEPWASMYRPEDMDIPEFVLGEFDDKPPHFKLTQQANPDFSYLKEEGEERPHWVHGAESHLQDRETKARNMAVYFGMVSMMDHYIGRILDKLEELDLVKNTVVVFTTDHGHFYGQHGLIAKAIHHYEDLVRIPWIVADPDCKKPGTRSNAMQSIVDLAKTFLGLAGIPQPMTMTGVDQSKVWKGEEVCARDHVLVENHFQPTKFYAKSYIDSRYKLTIYMNQTYGELYDLEKDPKELVNLWEHQEFQQIKMDLMLKMLHAELLREPLCMPRIAVA